MQERVEQGDLLKDIGGEPAEGAAKGTVSGGVVGLGLPEDDARHFDQGFREGGTLLTVDAGARTTEAVAILARHEVDLGPSGFTRYGDRRVRLDPAYAGPERRLVEV